MPSLEDVQEKIQVYGVTTETHGLLGANKNVTHLKCLEGVGAASVRKRRLISVSVFFDEQKDFSQRVLLFGHLIS